MYALTEKGRVALQNNINGFNKLPWATRQQFKLLFSREVKTEPLTLIIKVKNTVLAKHLTKEKMFREFKDSMINEGVIINKDYKIEVV
jgi:hypothetical protein